MHDLKDKRWLITVFDLDTFAVLAKHHPYHIHLIFSKQAYANCIGLIRYVLQKVTRLTTRITTSISLQSYHTRYTLPSVSYRLCRTLCVIRSTSYETHPPGRVKSKRLSRCGDPAHAVQSIHLATVAHASLNLRRFFLTTCKDTMDAMEMKPAVIFRRRFAAEAIQGTEKCYPATPRTSLTTNITNHRAHTGIQESQSIMMELQVQFIYVSAS